MNNYYFSLFLIFAIFNVYRVSSLNVFKNGTLINTFSAPQIPIRGFDEGFKFLQSELVIPKGDVLTGCDISSLENLENKILVTSVEGCSYSKKILNAWEKKAKGIILMTSKPVVAGASVKWGSQDIKEEDGVNLPAVEITIGDGNILIAYLQNKEALVYTVDMKSGEKNPWISVFDSPGMIVWQIFLSLIYFISLCMGIFKLYIIFKHSRSTLKELAFSAQSFIIYSVILSCSFCLTYLAVDPLHSRGVFNNMTDTVLATLGFPLAFIGTFYYTVVWVTSFNVSKILSRRALVLKIIKIFTGVIIFFEAIDILFGTLRGSYRTNFNMAIITGVVYLVITITIAIFYIVISFKVRRQMREMQTPSNNLSTFHVLEKKLNGYQWILAFLYCVWIIIACIAITSASWTPLGRPGLYGSIYLIVGCLNFQHIWMIQTPQRKIARSGSNTKISASGASHAEIEDSIPSV